MLHWADNDLLDSAELDKFECSLESPTAIPSSKGMAWEKDKLKMQLEQQEKQQSEQSEQRTLEMVKLKLDNKKDRPKNAGMFDPAKSRLKMA